MERSRREDHGANRRGIIVHPCRNRHGGQAVREHDHIFHLDAVSLRDVPRKGVHVFDHIMQAVGRAAFSRRATVTARVPRKNRNIIQT